MDESALLAAIASNPEEDTPRLVFADYLDNLDAVWKKCPMCDGAWLERTGQASIYDHESNSWVACPVCSGTGIVLDTTNADWAELIRVQCARSAARCEECGGFDAEVGPCGLTNYYRKCYSCDSAKARERELRAAHPEWTTMPCPDCGGKGENCGTCAGTGDLFHVPPLQSAMATLDYPTLWHNGFLTLRCGHHEAMHMKICPVCKGFKRKRGTCIRCKGRHYVWQSYPEVRAIAANKMVMGLRMSDFIIMQMGHPCNLVDEWVWYKDDSLGMPHYIPEPLWDLLPNKKLKKEYPRLAFYDSYELGTRAMSYATMRFTRENDSD